MAQTEQTKSTDCLKSRVQAIESKVDEYEEATNYEAKKTEYLNNLSTIFRELSRLKNRINTMEFSAAILSQVFDNELPKAVDDARNQARSIVEHDQDYYYNLVAEGGLDQYTQKIQQALGAVKQAYDLVQEELREIQADWDSRVTSARNVQRLVNDSQEVHRTLDDIDNFVNNRIWDDSEELSVLQSEWRSLMTQWEKGLVVDWDAFQKAHKLNDPTMNVLKRLADGEEILLDDVTKDIAADLLSVDELQNVVELSI